MQANKNNYIRLLNAKFKLGGRSEKELDCWGCVKLLYSYEGVALPNLITPSTRVGIDMMMQERIASDWEPCEDESMALVHIQVPKVFSHVGMSYGDGTFVHMWQGSKVVELQRIKDWDHRIKGFYRFVG